MYNENENESLEITFEELFQRQSFSNSDNFKSLSDRNKKSDMVFMKGGKLTVLKIK